MTARRLAPLTLAALAAAAVAAQTANGATQPVISNIADGALLRDSVDVTAAEPGVSPIVVRWGAVQFNEDSIGRRYVVRFARAGGTVNIQVPGEPADPSVVVDPAQLTEGGYRLTVRASERDCILRDPVTNACTTWAANTAAERTETASPIVDVTVDRTGPTVTSVVVNGGAAYTGSRSVAVAVTGEDTLSGVGQVQLSGTGTFSCDDTETCPQALTGPLGFTLPEGPDGPRTVSARLFDRAGLVEPPPIFVPPGNPSLAGSDAIFLDRQAPTARAAASATTAVVGQEISFGSAASTDDTDGSDDSGLDPAGTRWDLGDGNQVTGAAPVYAYTAPGRYTALLTVRDRAGNEDTDPVAITVTAPAQQPAGGPGGGGTVTTTPVAPSAPTGGTGTTQTRSLTAARVLGVWRARSLGALRVTLTRRTRVLVRVVKVGPGRRTTIVTRTARILGPGTATLRLRPTSAGVHRVVVVAGATTLTRTVRVRAALAAR